MRKLRLDCGFEVKAAHDDGRIEGYGSVFGNVDHGFDRVERGAFNEWLKSDFDGELPMLWQHSHDEPIGVWDEVSENRKGLYMSGQLNLSQDSGAADVPMAWKARALARQGAIKGLSIGYYPIDYSFEDDVRVLEKIALAETSMVTFPMNPLARVTGVKYSTRKELIQMLRENMGLSRKPAEALLSGGLQELRAVIGSAQRGKGDGDIANDLGELVNRIRGNSHG